MYITVIDVTKGVLMKFYNRENELEILKQLESSSKNSGKMVFIIGRRRVGKTRLILEAFKDSDFLYFFAAKKNEQLLCEEYSRLITQLTNKEIIGKLSSFKEVFEYVLNLTIDRSLTLAIDEFQEFYNINPSIYSDMQNIWDRYKDKSKVNLVLCGSIYSLMKKIFENAKEPLYGRADKKIILKPFNIDVLKNIYKDLTNTNFNNKDFFIFYVLTGGLAKYIEIFKNERAFTYRKMINAILSESSFFLNEGKDVLIEEFGKDYQTYFSILSLISGSKTSRSEIESILSKSVGGFISKLEREYNIIKKITPVLSKPNTRNIKYFIEDNFLNFWFRFIYKNISAVEMGNFGYVKKIIKRDFDTYLGRMLEKYFKEKLALTGEYSEIGSYWERDNKNEIDIVAINDFDKKVLIADVKLNKNKIDIETLKKKSEKLINGAFRNYQVNFKGFSIEDV